MVDLDLLLFRESPCIFLVVCAVGNMRENTPGCGYPVFAANIHPHRAASNLQIMDLGYGACCHNHGLGCVISSLRRLVVLGGFTLFCVIVSSISGQEAPHSASQIQFQLTPAPWFLILGS